MISTLLFAGLVLLYLSHRRLQKRVSELDRALIQLINRRSAASTVSSEDGAYVGQSVTDVTGRTLEGSTSENTSIAAIGSDFENNDTAVPGGKVSANNENTRTRQDTSNWDNIPEFQPMFGQNLLRQFGGLTRWLAGNWVLVVGAVSLALAGLFLVQYGIESGYLSPLARVSSSAGFGLLLCLAGEFLRRRFGDETDHATRFLPSALAGSGFCTLFFAVLAARGLYGLIEPATALMLLAGISVFCTGFGWFYGPLLSALGVVGALLAPFLVGGNAESPVLLLYYFLFVAIMTLLIDTFKQYGWLSCLGVAGVLISWWLLYFAFDESQHFLFSSIILLFVAVIIPARQWRPMVQAMPFSVALYSLSRPSYPSLLGFSTAGSAVLFAVFVTLQGEAYSGVIALVALAVIFLFTLFWLSRSSAFFDLSALPLIAYIAVLSLNPLLDGALYSQYERQTDSTFSGMPLIWIMAALGLAATALGFLVLRRRTHTGHCRLIAVISALFAPAVLFVLDMFWLPAGQSDRVAWASVLLVVALMLAILGTVSAQLKKPPEPKLYAAFYTSSAFLLTGLAAFSLFTDTALTLIIAILVLVVVWLDRRFDLPFIQFIAKTGLLVVSYRSVIDPGIEQLSSSGQGSDAHLAYVGPLLILIAAHVLALSERSRLKISIECAVWVLVAAYSIVLMEKITGNESLQSHWNLGVFAGLWLLLCLAQFRRYPWIGWFEKTLRILILGGLGVFILTMLLMLFTFKNPLFESSEIVSGIPFFSSLALAYLPPAVVLWMFAKRTSGLIWLCGALYSGSAFFVLTYIFMSVRHVWRGSDISLPGVMAPELYSYTLAMLIVSVSALVFAFIRRNTLLRTIAMVGVGLTIAKVFVIDMSDLGGLIRVLSFMGLGVSLLALTWLNRVMDAQWVKSPAQTGQPQRQRRKYTQQNYHSQ